ncbi:MAG: helix-hairpin-helix domain-containing protein [Chloroflexi bacterium]|nr:helix-hairpin-helix domain-containing protein [Chloroflexota bacterium]
MLRVEGLGPKRVKQVYETLGCTTLEELYEAAKAGKLRDLPKMGREERGQVDCGHGSAGAAWG